VSSVHANHRHFTKAVHLAQAKEAIGRAQENLELRCETLAASQLRVAITALTEALAGLVRHESEPELEAVVMESKQSTGRAAHLKSIIATLEAAVEAENIGAKEEQGRLVKRILELEKALEKYGQHTKECIDRTDVLCSCGLNNALRRP
jgi:hypothetical protein